MHSFCQPSLIVHTYMYYMHNALPFESLGFHKPSVSETLVLCSQTKETPLGLGWGRAGCKYERGPRGVCYITDNYTAKIL